ncbi:Tn3 family transposase [Streptomyces sp. NPDC051041]|uniref:Tn3 family transposase n=1 Tax=Streptomyces sp. NPDC051041 TaxID=3365640 RepID=UPI0037BE017A
MSGHELSYTANRHFSIVLLNEAIADLVNAHARLDVSQAWGDGTAVAADGTHTDTYLDNLLAETSVRYGKPGGIAHHHIPDTYIALFTHFIPCGVWEAVCIIEGLLKNTSEVKPTTVHADTQGQSQPVFALAHLLGFDLMPRIRNWKGMTFYRPSEQTEYVHIDALFGEPGKNVIDRDLIESQFRHLMRVAISVPEGAISSSTPSAPYWASAHPSPARSPPPWPVPSSSGRPCRRRPSRRRHRRNPEPEEVRQPMVCPAVRLGGRSQPSGPGGGRSGLVEVPVHRETGHAESVGDLLDGPLPLVVEPLDEHGLVRGELGLLPPSVPAADPTRSARDSISTLTSLRPGGRNPRRTLRFARGRPADQRSWRGAASTSPSTFSSVTRASSCLRVSSMPW